MARLLMLTVMMVMVLARVAQADLEPAHVVRLGGDDAQRNAARLANEAALALTRHDLAGALDFATRAVAANAREPWAHYARAEALARMGRLEDAMPEFALADQYFPANERWSHSIVTWGRANAYYQLGHCDEAKLGFNEYIRYVGGDDAAGADLARQRIAGCRPMWKAP